MLLPDCLELCLGPEPRWERWSARSRGRTALSGVVRAMVLMLVVLLASPFASRIPLAVLAGIALKVGIDIIDWEFGALMSLS